jgi:8-oxo-dGTP diphosphatase
MPEIISAQPIGVCVIVTDEVGRILLGKRKNSYKAGWFGIPGGRVEPGESLEVCAKRELFEETRLQATTIKYVGFVKEYQSGRDFIHFVFECPNWTGTVTTNEPDKCESWDWYSMSSLPEPIIPGHLHGFKLWQEKPAVSYLEI